MYSFQVNVFYGMLTKACGEFEKETSITALHNSSIISIKILYVSVATPTLLSAELPQSS
jgi:hypothetical protein